MPPSFCPGTRSWHRSPPARTSVEDVKPTGDVCHAASSAVAVLSVATCREPRPASPSGLLLLQQFCSVSSRNAPLQGEPVGFHTETRLRQPARSRELRGAARGARGRVPLSPGSAHAAHAAHAARVPVLAGNLRTGPALTSFHPPRTGKHPLAI